MTTKVASEPLFVQREAMSHKDLFTDEISWKVISFLTFHRKRFRDDWTMDNHYHMYVLQTCYTKKRCPCCQAREGGLGYKQQCALRWNACEFCMTAWILSATSMHMMNIVRMVGLSQRRYDEIRKHYRPHWNDDEIREHKRQKRIWRKSKGDIYMEIYPSLLADQQGGDKPQGDKVGYEPHCGQGCDEPQSWSSTSWWHSCGGDWQANTDWQANSSSWHSGGGDWQAAPAPYGQFGEAPDPFASDDDDKDKGYKPQAGKDDDKDAEQQIENDAKAPAPVVKEPAEDEGKGSHRRHHPRSDPSWK